MWLLLVYMGVYLVLQSAGIAVMARIVREGFVGKVWNCWFRVQPRGPVVAAAE